MAHWALSGLPFFLFSTWYTNHLSNLFNGVSRSDASFFPLRHRCFTFYFYLFFCLIIKYVFYFCV
uniref:Uncharacterized protein n=1 Tax=Daphnia magna TaxID=35525 RepID=A0A0P6GQT4_9CRUS